jgi:hypothetical protein
MGTSVVFGLGTATDETDGDGVLRLGDGRIAACDDAKRRR